MKKSVIALTLLSSGAVSASENKKFSDEEMVLKAIEMMCKDVWCEGTSDFFLKRYPLIIKMIRHHYFLKFAHQDTHL